MLNLEPPASEVQKLVSVSATLGFRVHFDIGRFNILMCGWYQQIGHYSIFADFVLSLFFFFTSSLKQQFFKTNL